MTLQLKKDYQQGIALRATAHKIAVKIERVIKQIDELTTGAGTNTSVRITHVQLRKFINQAKIFVNIANDPKSKKIDNMKLQLQLEKAFLDTQHSNIKQRQLLYNEMTNHPGTVKMYQPLMDALTILAFLNISEITNINFETKSAKLAENLLTVSTLNAYAELVRDHDVANNAIVARVTKPMISQFKMQINVKPKAFKVDLANSTEDQFAEKIKDGLKTIYLNRFVPEITELAVNRANEIFEVESDPTEFKQLEKHLSNLSEKNANSRFIIHPLTNEVTKAVYQDFVDKYKSSEV